MTFGFSLNHVAALSGIASLGSDLENTLLIIFNLMYEAHFKAIHQIPVEIYDYTKHEKMSCQGYMVLYWQANQTFNIFDGSF